MEEPFLREILSVSNKATDLEIHVSKLTVGDQVFLDIREYVPSLEQYGRGVTAPESFKDDISWGLMKW